MRSGDALKRRWTRWRVARRARRRRLRRKRLGLLGERAACRYLKRQGMVIVGRQVREGRGEIDLIAVDGRTVVFVEVKTRSSHHAGHPAEAVDRRKQRLLTATALAYLKRHHLLECSWRFDIVAVTWPADARRPRIEHFRAAFEPIASGCMFA